MVPATSVRWYGNYLRTVVERHHRGLSDLENRALPLGDRIWALPVTSLWGD